jgi:hypothetical protein
MMLALLMKAEDLTEKEFTERFDAGEDPRSLGFDLDNAVVEQPESRGQCG